MRLAAVPVVIVLLLPCAAPHVADRGLPSSPPLTFFGGDLRPTAGANPLLAEAYYNALRADEYVVVANPGTAPLDLAGWSLSDGEGTLTFPAGPPAPPGGRIVVAQNSTAFFEDASRFADYRYLGGNASAMVVSGTFQLNNAGDEVVLRDPSGAVVDVLAYGSSTYAGPGWTGSPALAVSQGFVARRRFEAGWRDTNASTDWDLIRVWSLGQSEFGPASFAFDGTVRAAVTPDAGLSTLLAILQEATATIDVSLYTFTNAPIANAFADASARGVRVRILLEGSPVGGIDTDEAANLDRLAGTAEIHFMVDNTTLDIQERYRYLHAKYAVLDGRTVVLSTENWGGSAFPTSPTTGSRGWMVAVEHAPLAAYFTDVFEEDFDEGRRDIFSHSEMTIDPVEPAPNFPTPRTPTFSERAVTGAFRIVPVLGPDTALDRATILGTLENATSSIHVEMFYADTVWGPFPNAYLEALVVAARRGVEVRLLLDSSWFNVDEDDLIDNDDTVRSLNGIAAMEGLDLQAKLVDLGVHGLSRVHTKGLIVDGRAVLVSSVNWNRASPTANREAGLQIENPDLAAYFEGAFAWDWKDDVTAPFADAGPDRVVAASQEVAFDGLGSSDNAAVTNFSWDLDGDGGFDHWGPRPAARYERAGTYEIRLRVSDFWNNTAEDTATVRVTGPSGTLESPWIVPAALLAVGGAIVVFLLVRRRRKGISKPP